MAQAACIASFASHSGVLHLYTDKALEAVVNKIAVDGARDKLEGFDILEWAAFAKKKSNIASSICKELGRLKTCMSASTPSRRCDLDPLHQSDPWAGASLAPPRSKHEGVEASLGQGLQKAPLWQNYFLRPSEQDAPGDEAPLWQKPFMRPSEQDTQGDEVAQVQTVEQAPLWQKPSVRPSELNTQGDEVPQVQNVEQDPPWQKSCVRPSEQDTQGDEVPQVQNVEQAPLRQKPFVRPSEQDAQGDEVPQLQDVCDRVSDHAADIPGKTCDKKPMVAALHVEWSRASEDDDLPMDDICDYFERFGQILETDMPECPRGRNLVKLDFVYGDAAGKTLRLGKHVVTRSDDGKQIAVKVYAKMDTRRKDAK